MLTLRPYQRDQREAVLRAFETSGSTLVVGPTGTGKTILFAEIARTFVEDRGLRAMVLANRDELVRQNADKIQQHTGVRPGIEMASERVVENMWFAEPYISSSIQTQLSGKRDKRYTKFDPNKFGLLVLDEADLWTAPGCRMVVEHYRQNPNLKVLGVTATPKRADGVGLNNIFGDSVAHAFQLSEAIREGWLVRIKQSWATVKSIDLSGVGSKCGDLSPTELEAALVEEKPLHGMIAEMMKRVGDRRTLVFAVTVKHAQLIAGIINREYKAGSAMCIHAGTEMTERRQLLDDYSKGKYQFFVNVGIATRGWDDSALDGMGVQYIAMMRPTKSWALAVQMIGRGTRPLPGLVDRYHTAEERCAAIAASAKPCIAEGELVLTDAGLVPIERVTTSMKVWDGIDFVEHDGVVFRGEQRVLTYAGLTATPDHEVWVSHDEAGESTVQEARKTFGRCAVEQAAIRVTGFGGTPVREADGHFRRGAESEWTAEDKGSVPVWGKFVEGLLQPDPAQSWVPDMRAAHGGSEMATAASSQCEGSLCESESSHLSALRWPRNPVQIQIAEGDGALGDGQSRTSPSLVPRSHRQRWALRARESRVLEPGTADVKYPASTYSCRGSCVSDRKPADRVLPTHSEEAAQERPGVAADHCSPLGAENSTEGAVLRTARVFDILNAGPRHRFTVSGLLVANCVTILDFVGNCGRHKLVYAADILGGSEAKYRDITGYGQGEGKPEESEVDVLIELEKQAKQAEIDAEMERRKGIKPKSVVCVTRDVDPFAYYDIEAPRISDAWMRGPKPTQKQIDYLVRNHVRGIDNIKTMAQASAIIDKMKNGPCSNAQAYILRNAGYDPSNYTRKTAGPVIDAIKTVQRNGRVRQVSGGGVPW